jgi:hypothetical protein
LGEAISWGRLAAAEDHINGEVSLKEYRFKILKKGDFLLKFSESEIVICSSSGDYRIYKVTGFDVGKPNFLKNYESATINDDCDIQEGIAVTKNGSDYRIYKIDSLESGVPSFDTSFCLVITNGIGKLEVFDTETEVTFTLPALEAM